MPLLPPQLTIMRLETRRAHEESRQQPGYKQEDMETTHPVLEPLRAVWNLNCFSVGVTMYWPSTTVTSAPRLTNLEVM